jgi:hypothetical protein
MYRNNRLLGTSAWDPATISWPLFSKKHINKLRGLHKQDTGSDETDYARKQCAFLLARKSVEEVWKVPSVRDFRIVFNHDAVA